MLLKKLKSGFAGLGLSLLVAMPHAQATPASSYSSGDYNPNARLEKISATLLAICSADDERHPPELGVLETDVKRVKRGRV